MLKKTLILLSLFFIIIFTSGYILVKRPNKISRESPSESQIQGIKSDITLIVNYGDIQSTIYSQAYAEGLTPYALLKNASEKDRFQLETKQYDFGIFVKAINDHQSTAKIAWIYFVNGKSGDIAADKYSLKSGDFVEWKYIAPSGNSQ